MATLDFTYEGKCDGEHVWFAVNINGTKRMTLTTTQTILQTERATDEDVARFSELLLAAFCRTWWKNAAPVDRTLPKLRTAIEAQEWVL